MYCVAVLKFAKYFLELKEDAKKRYENKMKIADRTKHPCCYLESKNAVSGSVEWSEQPDVTFADINNYLVVTVSLHTREQMKAFKSLDVYNFFINGWINSFLVLPIGLVVFSNC